MSSLPRLLLVCLLAWALPMQSVAAATMRFCMASSHLPPASQDQAGGHDAAAHVHDGSVEPAGAASDHGDAGTGSHSCSACSACCAASVLPASPLAVPVVEPLVEETRLTPPAYVGPDGAGLERPPRLGLG